MSAAAPRLQVEVWSDLVCPWCYIGKRQLERALERFEHRDSVDVTWRSFELTPNERAEPYLLNDYYAQARGMGPTEIAEKHERVTSMAAELGLEYRLDLAQLGNTFDGHRLIHLAADHGLQAAANERLLSAYMTEGRAIVCTTRHKCWITSANTGKAMLAFLSSSRSSGSMQTRTPFAFNNFRKTRMTFAAGMVSSTSNWCKGLSNSPARLREIGERH